MKQQLERDWDDHQCRLDRVLVEHLRLSIHMPQLMQAAKNRRGEVLYAAYAVRLQRSSKQ